MTKADLINAVAKSACISKKQANVAVASTLDAIGNSLSRGERVQIVGFGTFEVRARAPRKGRNPQDPKKIINIPGKKVPAFRPGKTLKDKVR
ncbi:MAG: HU family DNA-binding protein [Thermovirgaceae bacterium]|nr:HU family DNA-binding protein [Thermovirgaceae bacterium]